jgi:hypothetical protein
MCFSHIFSLSEHIRNSRPGIAQIHLKIPILNDPLDTEMAGAEYLGQARCDEKDELMEDFLDDYCKELNEDMGLLCTEEGDIVSVRETIGDGSQ